MKSTIIVQQDILFLTLLTCHNSENIIRNLLMFFGVFLFSKKKSFTPFLTKVEGFFFCFKKKKITHSFFHKFHEKFQIWSSEKKSESFFFLRKKKDSLFFLTFSQFIKILVYWCSFELIQLWIDYPCVFDAHLNWFNFGWIYLVFLGKGG